MAISTIGASALETNAVTADKLSSDVLQLGKNLLINGGMHVAQRGDQTGQGGGTAYTALDRWENRWAAGTEQARFTTSRDSLSVANTVLAGGVRHALLIDCTTAETAVAAGEMEIIVQKIEGQHLQHLQFGNAAAKTLSISFGISSPKSGTHCVALYSPDGNRGYIAEFTVAAADTFEVIKIEGIPGDTAGTINNDTGEGMRIAFPLICGSSLQDSAGAWFTGEKYATSNQQNLLDNTANNISITRVQLEVGSVATDFEHEDISTTLRKCQRYYYRRTGTEQLTLAYFYATNAGRVVMIHPVEMRAAPTFGKKDTTVTQFRYGGLTAAAGLGPGLGGDGANTWSATIAEGVASTPFTVGQVGNWEMIASDDWIAFSAEL